MVSAEIFKNNAGLMTGFSITGHANTAPRGQDIYCAGVSSLSQSVLLCMKNHLKREFEADFGSGLLMLKLKNPPDALTEAVFQTMLIGILEIAKIAPQAVEVKFTEQ